MSLFDETLDSLVDDNTETGGELQDSEESVENEGEEITTTTSEYESDLEEDSSEETGTEGELQEWEATQSADSSNSNDSMRDIIKQLIQSKSLDQISGKLPNWQDLIDFMKNERDDNYLGHSPITENDFNGTTLFNQIDNKADMDNTNSSDEPFDWDDFLENLKTSKSDFWNESVSKIIKSAIVKLMEESEGEETSANITYTDATDETDGNRVEVENTKGIIGVSNGVLKNRGGFRVTSIKNANAGNNFGERNATWVIPNYNIDAETYSGVRGNDKMLEALKSDKEMQFTHTQDQSTVSNSLNKYIRLLMPKYLRRVEVEDLNRNFWVIGQSIAAISAFLFDEKGILPKAFEGILSEITQLWENVMYLWAGLAIEQSGKKYTKVHTEVVYLPNNEFEDYMSYDGFRSETAWATIMDRVAYLIDSYPECNLCIVPVIRHGNYEHNYYKGENWPGVIFYDRNNPKSDNHGFFYLRWHYDNVDRSEGNFNTDDFINCASGFIETENGISYVKPFSDIVDDETLGNEKYYMAIRSIPAVSVEYVLKENALDPNVTYNYFTNLHLQVDFIDVARDLEERLNSASYNTIESLKRRRVAYLQADSTSYLHVNTNLPSIVLRQIDDSTSHNTVSFSITNKGYYLGELMSTSMVTEARYKLKVGKIPLTPINNEIDNIEVSSTEAKNRTTAITSILKNHLISFDENQLALYAGRSKVALYKDKEKLTSNLGQYFDYSVPTSPQWKENYSDSSVNSSSETYDIGAVLYLPWGEQILHENYRYASRQMPARAGTKAQNLNPDSPIHNIPKIWKGGRTCCSYITLEGMKNNQNVSTDRHRELLSYYYMWTPDGKKPTENSNFVLYFTQVTVNYGILPIFRNAGSHEETQSICITNSEGNYNYPLTKNSAFYSPNSYCNFIDNRGEIDNNNDNECIDKYGRKYSDNYPRKWSSDPSSNASAFIWKKQYGWAVDSALFKAFLKYIGKYNSRYNHPDGLTVHFKYIHRPKNAEDKYGTVYEDNNDPTSHNWSFSLLGPWRAGKDDCEISTDNETVETTYVFTQEMLDEFKKYNKGNYSKMNTETLGGISSFFGSVTEIKTYKYYHDSNGLGCARVNWWSRYYTNNNLITTTDCTNGFYDVTKYERPSDLLINPLEMTGNLQFNGLENWKLAYAGDLQSENIEKEVKKYLEENEPIKPEDFYKLQEAGVCPDFTHFHYNGYNEYTRPQS